MLDLLVNKHIKNFLNQTCICCVISKEYAGRTSRNHLNLAWKYIRRNINSRISTASVCRDGVIFFELRFAKNSFMQNLNYTHFMIISLTKHNY